MDIKIFNCFKVSINTIVYKYKTEMKTELDIASCEWSAAFINACKQNNVALNDIPLIDLTNFIGTCVKKLNEYNLKNNIREFYSLNKTEKDIYIHVKVK